MLNFSGKNSGHRYDNILSKADIFLKDLKEKAEYYGSNYNILIKQCSLDEEFLDYYITNAEDICKNKRFT